MPDSVSLCCLLIRALCRAARLLALLLPGLAAAAPDASPMACHLIPGRGESLCVQIIPSQLGPYDEVDIYRQAANPVPVFLARYRGGVALFNGLGFSEHGRLMWLSWTEEGHAYYSFYDTARYLAGGRKTPPLALLDDPHVEFIQQFSDDGRLVYALDPDNVSDCPASRDGPAHYLDPNTNTRYCLKDLLIK